MGDRLKYERFIWFHNRVISDKYPNARSISEKFEISPRTAQRDIEFIRDRLGAPLDYEPQRKAIPIVTGHMNSLRPGLVKTVLLLYLWQ
jgi:predicted DNA-binding transcriptional regulator YafY